MSQLLVSLIFISSYANAGFPVEKAKNFISNKDICNLAIGMTAYPDNSGKTIEDTIFCVTTLTLRKGTIDEKRGCSLAEYRMSSGQFRPETIIMTNKKTCEDGGFEALIKEGASCQDGTVKCVLTKGPSPLSKPIFLYASEEKFKKWFEEERARLQQAHTKGKNK